MGRPPHVVGRFEWERALRHLPLKMSTTAVALMLATYADANGENAHPGSDRLANDLNTTDRTIREHLKILRDLGLVQRVFEGSSAGRRRLADEYALALPPDILARFDHRKPASAASAPITGSTALDHRKVEPDHRKHSVAITGSLLPPTTPCTKDVDHSSPDPSRSRLHPHRWEAKWYSDDCLHCPLPQGNEIHRSAS